MGGKKGISWECGYEEKGQPLVRFISLLMGPIERGFVFVHHSTYPGQTIRPETDQFQDLPEISWKQYFGDRILLLSLPGFIRNQQEPATTDSRIRSPVPLAGLRVFSRDFQRGNYRYPAGFRRK
ncbi:hypothetical protein I4U23_026782 [Adineta vaga]|nr:hypothetical protein I4U23_026782 [Adineta vaga]